MARGKTKQNKGKKRNKGHKKEKQTQQFTGASRRSDKSPKKRGQAIPPKQMEQQKSLTLQAIVEQKAPGWEHAKAILQKRRQQAAKTKTALSSQQLQI